MPRQKTETTKVEVTQEKERIPNIPNNPLKMKAEDYYHKTLRPLMSTLGLYVKVDDPMLITIDEVVNRTDGNLLRMDNDSIEDMRRDFKMLIDIIDDKYYLKPHIAALEEKKKEKIRFMMDKIQEFYMILQYTKPVQAKDEKKPERINYDEENGRNNDYINRNMEKLTEAREQTRLPNIPVQRYNI